MEFDSFSEFYEQLNAYYVDKPGKKPPTKIDVQLMIEDILAAKVKIVNNPKEVANNREEQIEDRLCGEVIGPEVLTT
ncbi:Hypothetical protein CINCED_3A016604 [Cinara cedri]|uniref:Uncharacterized protein n=1 Tax=Cinara cedri TaxID=506608 RepID=A0A5E4M7S6_9HEMI|nr:Hypothetical protein CINCED_3A016604 [Cinara cedri]